MTGAKHAGTCQHRRRGRVKTTRTSPYGAGSGPEPTAAPRASCLATRSKPPAASSGARDDQRFGRSARSSLVEPSRPGLPGRPARALLPALPGSSPMRRWEASAPAMRCRCHVCEAGPRSARLARGAGREAAREEIRVENTRASRSHTGHLAETSASHDSAHSVCSSCAAPKPATSRSNKTTARLWCVWQPADECTASCLPDSRERTRVRR